METGNIIKLQKNINELTRVTERIRREADEKLNKGKRTEYINDCNVLKGIQIAKKVLLKTSTTKSSGEEWKKKNN